MKENMTLTDKVVDTIKSSTKIYKLYIPKNGNLAYSDNYHVDKRLVLVQYNAAIRVEYDNEILAVLDGDDLKVIMEALELKLSTRQQDNINRFINGG